MKPSLISSAIMACAAMNRPLFIWGPPGVGKSDTVRQAVLARRAQEIAAAKLTGDAAASAQAAPIADGTHFGMVDFRAALRDAVDIMGLPGAVDGRTFYNQPAGLPGEGWKGILFLDEMNSAPPQTQAALFQLVLDRGVGDYRLGADVRIVAAGNRTNDRGVVHRMPDPLVDRFFHVDYETELQDWCGWALAENVRPEVVAFVRFRPALLHSHDTARQCHAFSTPRGWADVSPILGLALQPALEGELIRGRVGDGAAAEFLAFLKLYRGMISPDEVMQNPTTAKVPENVGVLYALAEALARRATVANFDRVLTYARRMPQEYAQALVSSATRISPELCNTMEFIKWASSQP